MSGATKRDRSPLGGLVRGQLIRELALAEITRTALAEKYGVTPGAITLFAQRHAEQIAAVRRDAENEFAGILIAEKARRLAALEELHEIAMTPQPRVAPSGKVIERDGEVLTEVDGRLAAQVLKQAAEEMGQLPTRLQVSGEMGVTTNYKIEGVSPEDLR